MVFKIGSTTFDGELVDDSTPQLSGALDVNGNEITSASNNNIVIHPNGNGQTKIKGDVELNADDEAVNVNIARHNGTNGLMLGGILVTASVGEINKLDGLSSTTNELNILNGVTATTNELNVLDVGTGENVGIFKVSTSVPTQTSDFTGNTKIIMVY